MFELLDSIIFEIRKYNILQVVTKNSSNFVIVGKMLKKE